MVTTGLAIGLSLRSFQLRERYRFHQDRASYFRLLSIPNRCVTADFQEGLLKIVDGPDGFEMAVPASPIAALILHERKTKRSERLRAYEALGAYHARRAHEFELAARFPWVSVTIDPPPSEPE
jgi:hypothetical protein